MNKALRAKIIDVLLLAMIILPFVGCMVLRVLTRPLTEGISISGAQVYLDIPMPVLGNLIISESQVVSAAVMLALLGLCLFLTHGIAVVQPPSGSWRRNGLSKRSRAWWMTTWGIASRCLLPL